MTSVATLISRPGELTAARLAAASAAVGPPPPALAWLAAGTACDLELGERDPAGAAARLRRALAGAAVDVAVQPAAGRRKRLLVADLESTLIRNEMLDELAERVGARPEVEAITARAMAGALDFRAALEERVALLRGLPVEALEEVAGRIELTSGAAALVATSRAHGVRTAVVTGGFGVFARRVAAELGIDAVAANELEVAEGRLTGRVLRPILDRRAKAATLRRLASAAGLTAADALAVGDGANDLAMLRLAGSGVAFRAKPAVARAVRLALEHADLTGLLYLQGYREEEIRRPPRGPGGVTLESVPPRGAPG